MTVAGPQADKGRSNYRRRLFVILLLLSGLAVARQLWQPQLLENGQDSYEKAALAPEPEKAKKEPVNSAAPSFDVVRASPAGEIAVAGRAQPHAKVKIFAGNMIVGETKADQEGEWVIVPEKPLAKGNYTLSLEALPEGGGAPVRSQTQADISIGGKSVTDKPGQTAAPSPSNRILTELQPAPAAPAPKTAPDTEAKADIPAMEAAPAPHSAPAPADFVERDAPDFTPNEETANLPATAPAAKTRIKQDGESKTGLEPFPKARPSENEGVTRFSDKNGSISRFRPDSTDLGRSIKSRSGLRRSKPNKRRIIVRKGDTLWGIAVKRYGRGGKYTRIYRRNRKRIRNPNLIYPDQRIIVPR